MASDIDRACITLAVNVLEIIVNHQMDFVIDRGVCSHAFFENLIADLFTNHLNS